MALLVGCAVTGDSPIGIAPSSSLSPTSFDPLGVTSSAFSSCSSVLTLSTYPDYYKEHEYSYLKIIVVRTLFWRNGPTLPTTKVTATATTTTTKATGQECHQKKTCLGPGGRQHKVCLDIFLSKLLTDVKSERAITIIDTPLGAVGENSVTFADFFELSKPFAIQILLTF